MGLMQNINISGILGPRGSGVYWLRHMIEQITGLYTGSVYNVYPEVFRGEGKTDEVTIKSDIFRHWFQDMTIHVFEIDFSFYIVAC